MLNKVAVAAKKALSLDQGGVFKLLVIMTALLCWIMAVGAGSMLGLNQIYTKWQLDRQGEISIYLLADTPKEEVENLIRNLGNIAGVKSKDVLTVKETKQLISPYFQEDSAFPLPIIIDIKVNDKLNRSELETEIYNALPTAEIGDAQEILTTTAKVIRLVQMVGILLITVALAIMGLLVMLTVRAGLRGQKRCLSILQFLGGTDRFLTSLVVRQVALKSLIGWGVACVISLITLIILAVYFPSFRGLLLSNSGLNIWVGVIFIPLIVPLVAVITANFTAKNIIRGKV